MWRRASHFRPQKRRPIDEVDGVRFSLGLRRIGWSAGTLPRLGTRIRGRAMMPAKVTSKLTNAKVVGQTAMRSVFLISSCFTSACFSRGLTRQTANPTGAPSCFIGTAAEAPSPMLSAGASRSSDKLPRGSLDKEVLRTSIRLHNDSIRGCYETLGLSTDPHLSGRAVFTWMISPEGGVLWSRLAESSLRSSAVEECIGQSICGWTFPRPDGGGVVIVTYPYTFTPATMDASAQ